MFVKVDQTGVVLFPGGSDKTCEEKGPKQVTVFGKDEKRAFTGVVCIIRRGGQKRYPGH